MPAPTPTIILGIDPGLEHTGWGVISASGNQLSYVASGTINTRPSDPMAQRLGGISAGLNGILAAHQPHLAAVEEVFVNTNARSSLKLGQARGVCLLLPFQHGIPVAEYAATRVKQSLVGTGKAEKTQVSHMVKLLLPRANPTTPDESDALAVAITHAHHVAYHRLTTLK